MREDSPLPFDGSLARLIEIHAGKRSVNSKSFCLPHQHPSDACMENRVAP